MTTTTTTDATGPEAAASTPPPRKKSRAHVVTSIVIAVVAAAFIGLLGYGLKLDPKKLPTMMLDKPALPFDVAWIQGQSFIPGATGQSFKLSDLKGRPVVLNFWASWCVSCREEARELEQFWREYQNDVVVVGIAIQDEKDSAIQFAKYFGKTYVLGLDVDGKAAIDYGVSGVPETFLIDREGVIRHKEIGPVTGAMLKTLLPKIL